MWYLAHPGYSRQPGPDGRWFVSRRLCDDARAELIESAAGRLKRVKKKKNYRIDLSDGERYFCKTYHIKHLGRRLKTTLGIRRRGRYHRPVEEIINHLQLLDRDYIPRLTGYGCCRDRSGLIDGVAVVTEHVEDALNVQQFIERYPQRAGSALYASFDLIDRHLRDGLLHLDIWAGNILLKQDLSRTWLVDLEQCRVHAGGAYPHKLGLCLGYFYHHRLSPLISRSAYFTMLHDWLGVNVDSRDHVAVERQASRDPAGVKTSLQAAYLKPRW